MDSPPRNKTPKEQLVRKCLANHILNETLHRTRSHLRIESLPCEEGTQLFSKTDLNLFLLKLLLQRDQELVDDTHDDVSVERLKRNDGIETIAELRREHALNVLHLVTRLTRIRKADRALIQRLSARVRGHDDDHVSEIRLATVVVGQGPVVHHL